MDLRTKAKLINNLRELDIDKEQRKSLLLYLDLIDNRDHATAMHCIRVAYLCKKIAEFTNVVEPKALFYAGLLHDVGKALTDPTTLKKTVGFDKKDMKEMKSHPVDGYRLLKGIHDFSARILLFHHSFVGEGYPKEIPATDIDWSKGTETNIMFYARVLALADFYDAALNRKNDKFSEGKAKSLTRDEVWKIMLEHNTDQNYFIDQLFEKEVF